MIQLNKSYGGYPAGAIAQFNAQLEAALITQGYGLLSTGPVSPGNVTTTERAGRAGIAAGANAVTVYNPSFNLSSKFLAFLSDPVEDTSGTGVVLVTPGVGYVIFTLNANAAATVAIDWLQVVQSGLTQVNS